MPIQAMAARELVYDDKGQVVREKRDEKQRKRPRSVEATAAAAELKPGQTRKETEGVFLLRGKEVLFEPVKVGIAGDKYFEVLGGLKEGEQVITGPFNSVRNLRDGDEVKLQGPAGEKK